MKILTISPTICFAGIYKLQSLESYVYISVLSSDGHYPNPPQFPWTLEKDLAGEPVCGNIAMGDCRRTPRLILMGMCAGGGLGSPESIHSSEIDRRFLQDRLSARSTYKLLLLGGGESGKKSEGVVGGWFGRCRSFPIHP